MQHAPHLVMLFFFFLFLPSVLKGTPEFVIVSQCIHHFEWRTYAACRRDKFRPLKEVSAVGSGEWKGVSVQVRESLCV